MIIKTEIRSVAASLLNIHDNEMHVRKVTQGHTRSHKRNETHERNGTHERIAFAKMLNAL